MLEFYTANMYHQNRRVLWFSALYDYIHPILSMSSSVVGGMTSVTTNLCGKVLQSPHNKVQVTIATML